ncbi:hypothetical protein RvY_03821-2 [Ramazzottius varieornatus]|uniref:Matrix-remodeling-associated protein 7 helical domain-containing protein n=1 Tax=Ramazzottius varieornatus TaxID=947166 RepID=A0A1D1UT15_RAMVA|nr:hypothetical protein RvY_03821-2 [Ramazzottius varieornatus]
MEDIKRMASDIFREYSSWASWLYVRYYRPNRMYLTSTNISIIVVTLLAGIVGSVYLLRKRRLEGRRMYEDGNEEDNVDMDRITDQWMKRLDLKLEDKMGKKDKKGDKTNAKKVNNEDSSLSRPQHVAGPANCPFNHLFGPLLDTGNVDGRDYHQLATAFPIMESLAKDGGDERNTMAELAHQIKKSIRERGGEKLEVIGNNLNHDSAEEEDADYMDDMPALTGTSKKAKGRDPLEFAMHIPGELKKIENKITTREMEKGLSEKQRLQEVETRRQQLEQIFKLMEREKDKFGDQNNEDLEEQMRMYAL